jgi:hemerythrin superfamily protein
MEKTDDDEAKEFVFEGEQEHALVHQLMELLAKSRRKGDLKWHARFKALKDMLDHHIEEEESEAFPKVEELFDSSEQEKMAEEFEKKKEKIAA